MLSLNRILVGVDFDPVANDLPLPTREAVKKAIWLAAAKRASVTLFSALDDETTGPEVQIEGVEVQDTRDVVNEMLAPFLQEAQDKGVAIASKIVVGRGWLELTKEVIREGYDLLIVGTKNVAASQQMIYGSTDVKLLRKCPCPLWITRPDVNPLEVTTIVAADDLSPVANKVLNAAVTAASLISARLLVVHAIAYRLESALKRTECPMEMLDEYRDKVRRDAEQHISTRLAQTDYRTLDQGTQILIQAGPADTIIEQAVVDHDADLLVMGTIARGGIPGFVIGNTAERLLPRLKCSILAVKPDDFVSPIKPD